MAEHDDGPSQAFLAAQKRLAETRRTAPRLVYSSGPSPVGQRVARTLAEVMERGRELAASDDEVRRYQLELERNERRNRIINSGIADVLTPQVIDAVVMDRLQSTDSLEVVRQWRVYQRTPGIERSVPICAVIGTMGLGKTVAAAWLLSREGGRYIEAEELCKLHSAKWGEERALYQRVLSTGVLVVDELGTESDHRVAMAALHDVVNKRQGKTATLLLGNLDIDELQRRYDARTIDRLREASRVIEVAGESMRRGQL